MSGLEKPLSVLIVSMHTGSKCINNHQHHLKLNEIYLVMFTSLHAVFSKAFLKQLKIKTS